MSPIVATDDPIAIAAVEAIHAGDLDTLRALLEAHQNLAQARFGDSAKPDGMTRTLLHVVADWPGHFPNGAATVALLAASGADVNARFTGPHTETPLHWAASSDDVAVLDALLDAGADIEADGAVIAGATPLMDAVAFGQWRAARRLVERGAATTFWQAAALGLTDVVEASLSGETPPDAAEIQSAFWAACHGGQLAMARRLHDCGADVNWIPPWESTTALDAARRSEAFDVLTWLHRKGPSRPSRSPAATDGEGTPASARDEPATSYASYVPSMPIADVGALVATALAVVGANQLRRSDRRQDGGHP